MLSIVDNKDLGYRLGAFDYLLKPFDREAILATLGHIPSQQGRSLVDDDPQVVDLVRQLLEGELYEIAAATTVRRPWRRSPKSGPMSSCLIC